MEKKRLSERHERFVQGVVAGKTRTQAYRDAYKQPKMSAKIANGSANRLMKRPLVAARYALLRERVLGESERKAVASGQAVVEELAKLAFANSTDYVRVCKEKEGEGVRLELVATQEIPLEKRAAIAGYEKTSGGVRLRMHDKLRALDLLGKCFGVFGGDFFAEASKEGDGVFRVDIRVVDGGEDATEKRQKK